MPHSGTPDTAQLVVAFRTHLWNEDIARLARRLRHFSQGAAFVVLMDETRGPVPAGNFVTVTHNDDFSDFGLPAYPEDESLWHNADYPLYRLRRQYPEATHYAMVEYDVAVNTDIMPMLRQAQQEAVDLIAADLGPADPQWVWYNTVGNYYRTPLRAFIPFLVVSARGVDKMYQERRRIAAVYDAAGGTHKMSWPFCEAFIPSAIASLENASLRNLAAFVRLPSFKHRPEEHIDDPAMNHPGTVCHPVAGGALFVNRRLGDVTFDEMMDAQSKWRRQLEFCDPLQFGPALHNWVAQERDPDRRRAFMALAKAQRWPLHALPQNIALFKPALMSSSWSGNPPIALAALAAGGNNGVIDGGFGFHTEFETNAWWQVDLQHAFLITHILVFNRLDQAARCRRLRAEGSPDGKIWRVLVEKTDDALFGGVGSKPLLWELPADCVARFIRLTNVEHNYFHLDEVQILGRVPG